MSPDRVLSEAARIANMDPAAKFQLLMALGAKPKIKFEFYNEYEGVYRSTEVDPLNYYPELVSDEVLDGEILVAWSITLDSRFHRVHVATYDESSLYIQSGKPPTRKCVIDWLVDRGLVERPKPRPRRKKRRKKKRNPAYDKCKGSGQHAMARDYGRSPWVSCPVCSRTLKGRRVKGDAYLCTVPRHKPRPTRP